MLVYGDPEDRADPLALIEDLRRRVEERGCDTWAFVEGGRLVQGLLDAAMSAQGEDECTPLSDGCADLMMALARRDSVAARGMLERIAAASPSGRICLRVPEGYAFYAVYPELYAQAALEVEEPVQAIGIRSIGTSLAAGVAARGAVSPLFLRPVGDPFRRELRLGRSLRARLRADSAYAVVDEGPGLSGSSFLCVARELMRRGVPPARIHLFPSHDAQPGPRAGDEDRELWRMLPRHVRPFEALLDQLPRWCGHLTGPPQGSLQDLGAGRWRAFTGARVPANVREERRKYLLRTDRDAFLLKFSGLGAAGDAVLRRARVLSDGGFAPPVLGLCEGFLVSRWVDARPAKPGPELLERAAEYVAFRSRELRASEQAGATPECLLQMARRNLSVALGDDAARALERWLPHLGVLSREVWRVETDNRMHAWEWIQAPGGRIFKTDAADHCRSHDLIGCQDPAWDLVGASIELGLDPVALLRRFRAHGGRGAAQEVLAFSRLCYLAFQLGAAALASEALSGLPEESALLAAESRRYRALLVQELRT